MVNLNEFMLTLGSCFFIGAVVGYGVGYALGIRLGARVALEGAARNIGLFLNWMKWDDRQHYKNLAIQYRAEQGPLSAVRQEAEAENAASRSSLEEIRLRAKENNSNKDKEQ